MPHPSHRRQAPAFIVSRATVAAVSCCLLALCACGRRDDARGEITVVLDSIRHGAAEEVVFVPADPAPLLASRLAAVGNGPLPDSLRNWRVFTDSAAVLDRRFQMLRDTLNRDARAMEGADRRSADYARRFDALRARTRTAEAMRADRDRLRKRADALRPALAREPRDASALRRDLLALADGERRAASASFAGGIASTRLMPGSWWVGVPRAGALEEFVRVEVRAGGRDTLRP